MCGRIASMKDLITKLSLPIIVVSFLLVVAIILAGGYFAYVIQERAIVYNRYYELSAIKTLKVNQIVEWRKERVGDANIMLKNLLLTNEIKSFLKQGDSNSRNNILTWFNLLKKSYAYEAIILTDKEFNPTISTEEKLIYSQDHLNDYYDLLTKDSVVISSLHKTEDEDIHLTLRINLKENDDVYAHILIRIDPYNFLFPLIESWPTPSKTAETILVKAQGDSLIYLNELRHLSNTALELKKPMSEEDLPSVRALLGQEGIFRGYDYRGVKVLADISKIPGSDWAIISKIDEDEIFGSLKSSLRNSVIVLIILIAMSYVIFILIWRSLKFTAQNRELTLQKEKLYFSEHLRLLNEYANDAIFTSDSNRNILYANKKAAEIYGFERDELLSMKMDQLISPKSLEVMHERLQKLMENKSILYESYHVRKNGEIFPVELSITYFSSEDNDYILSIHRDISERKEAEKNISHLTNLYATLSQINQTIVRESNKEELFKRISKIPVEFGNMIGCALYIIDENTEQLTLKSRYGIEDYFNYLSNQKDNNKFEDFVLKTIDEDKLQIINSLKNYNDSSKWITRATETGINSCASAAIHFYSKPIGAIVLYSQDENYFHTPELNLLEEITTDISFALEVFDRNQKREQYEREIEENEKRLARLFSNLPGIAYRCIVDRDWTMEFMSEGAFNITGYTPNEFIENKIISYGDLILPEDRQFVWDEIQSAIEKNTSFTLVYRIKPREGDYRWVWERGVAIKNSSGNFIALEGFITDITDTKEASEKLRKSEESFKYLFKSNPLPMWIYDLEKWNFLEVNYSAIVKYGYSKDEFKSMTLLDLRPEEEKQKLIESLKKPRKSVTESGEWKHILKNGDVIDVLIISNQIEFNNRNAVLVVAVDITDRKIAQTELIIAKEKAEALNKLKSEFLAQMSHEIRTPVNVILSFSNFIKDTIDSYLDQDIKEGFNAIEHASTRLIRTIDSILNMAQIQTGAFEINPEVISLYDDILLILHKEFLPFAQSKNLIFSIEVNCNSALIEGDSYSISQLFANLIDNAIKYTEKGEVKINLLCSPENIFVEITDTGVGISEEFLPNIFHAFSQEETGYTRRFEGSGLGLALVKSYCDMNKAKIEVKSKKNIGTTFTVSFPKI